MNSYIYANNNPVMNVYNVLALTNANGTVVAEYTYDAWGNILTQSGEMASVNPYRYAGYRYDEETKLYYLMARTYNPDTGVFLSLDPVRGDTMNPITMNGYNYANNNPVMMVDPDGEIAQAVLWTILRVAVPIVKKIGQKATPFLIKKYGKQVVNLANKMLKGNKNIKIFGPTNKNVIVVVYKGTRVLSIDYHGVKAMFKDRRFTKSSRDKTTPIWHYHFKDPEIHYIFRWAIPSGRYIKPDSKHILVW